MAIVAGAAGALVAAVVLLPGTVAVSTWIPALPDRRGGIDNLPSHMLVPSVQYGRVSFVAQTRARAMQMKGTTGRAKDATEDAPRGGPVPEAPTPPVRHRLVVCNAYRGSLSLAAIHKRPGRAAIPARWDGDYIANKTLISGIPFKTCDVSLMAFREGDYIAFKLGGKDVGSFNTSGALGLTAGQEVSLVLVPYRTLSNNTHGTQFISHVFRTPKQKGGSQVILADTLKSLGKSTMKMEDRSGHFWPVHDDQEVNLQAGTYHFTALDDGGANVSYTALQVSDNAKDSASAKYLVLRTEADMSSTVGGTQEFLTFSLPVPSKVGSTNASTVHSVSMPAGAAHVDGPPLRDARGRVLPGPVERGAAPKPRLPGDVSSFLDVGVSTAVFSKSKAPAAAHGPRPLEGIRALDAAHAADAAQRSGAAVAYGVPGCALPLAAVASLL